MRTVDQDMETKQLRRMRAEDKALTKLEKREKEAEQLIGKLMRNGKEVCYINIRNPEGKLTGKTKEGDEYDLIAYLLRNNYA
jgi:hypothetical protein